MFVEQPLALPGSANNTVLIRLAIIRDVWVLNWLLPCGQSQGELDLIKMLQLFSTSFTIDQTSFTVFQHSAIPIASIGRIFSCGAGKDLRPKVSSRSAYSISPSLHLLVALSWQYFTNCHAPACSSPHWSTWLWTWKRRLKPQGVL